MSERSKRIILFCDGTWKTPDHETNSSNQCTNVVKMARSVAPLGDDGVKQVVYYDKGLGTGRFDKYLGGLFGWGISKSIQGAYRFLVEQFEPGDEIFLFGFSRGAYTVRSVASLIDKCGILKRAHVVMTPHAYARYRRYDDEANVPTLETRLFRQRYAHPEAVCRIKCIGAWDTVGGWAAPRGGFQFLNKQRSLYKDKLGSHIDHAYHALAIDEQRLPFKVTLWQAAKTRITNRQQTLEQVWFAGCHSDVGGGNENPSLSDIPLAWMKEKAAGCGLAITGDRYKSKSPVPLGEIKESRVGYWTLLPKDVRWIQGGTDDGGFVTNESIHASVYARLQRKTNPAYQPVNIPTHTHRERAWYPLSEPTGRRPIGQGAW